MPVGNRIHALGHEVSPMVHFSVPLNAVVSLVSGGLQHIKEELVRNISCTEHFANCKKGNL